MATFETMHFNPAEVDSVEDVRKHVLYMMGLGSGYQSRDFSKYVQTGDELKLDAAKKSPLLSYAWELVGRGAPALLRFSEDRAKNWIAFFFAQDAENDADLKAVEESMPRSLAAEQDRYLQRKKETRENFTEVPPNPVDYDFDLLTQTPAGRMVIALHLATQFYERLETETYVKAMELNFLDYRAVFTDSPCVHDPDAVMNRLMNPQYELTKEERVKHFAENRAQSFSVLAGMSAFEVKSKVLQADDAVLASANRYNSLKEEFTIAGETWAKLMADEPAPADKIGSSLDDLIM